MNNQAHPHNSLPTASRTSLSMAALVGGALAIVIVLGGTAARLAQSADLKRETALISTPTAMVFQSKPSQAGVLALPGRVQAWNQAPVYARTNGYLKQWYVDIGTQVKAGQVLADIEAPDVDQQLAAAKAALATAQANYALSKTTADRWDKLLAEGAVSQQDADDKRGDLAAKQATRDQAAANVAQLQTLTGFDRIVAPFDGTVTSRATDIGALISAGGASPTPLFTVSDTTRLRIYVSVPENEVGALTDGQTATFTVPEQPNKTFTATVARSSEAVDPTSGAMLIQLVVDNKDHLLKPGGYAQVSLNLPQTAQTDIRIPASALLFRSEGTAVAVVGPDNKVAIHKIQIARDFGTELEVASGIAPGDWIVDSPSDAIAAGQTVRPVHKPQEAAAHAKS